MTILLIIKKITLVVAPAIRVNIPNYKKLFGYFKYIGISVEAARAGEQGRGFAVVASEVQKLAEQSKSVVYETQKEEDEMVKCISKVLELSDSLGDRMNKINTDISIIAKAITDIANKSDEIVKSSKKLKI